jgi:ABC-2 type transport system permease protein
MSGVSIRFSRRRFFALIVKEVVQIVRDPSTFLIAFVLPMILLFLFGYGVSLDSNRIQVGLVLEDDSSAALSLAQAYQNSVYFDVETSRTVADARVGIISENQRAIIVIPEEFGAAVERGEMPPIQIITDGSQPNTASFATAYAEGVHGNWAQAEGLGGQTARAPPVSVSTRFWFNPELKSRYFLVPGSIAIVMTMIGTLLTALVVAREWERGTMEAMMATPISLAEFIASKLVPYFLLGLVSMALCTVVGIVIFGVPFRGSILALLVISSAFLLPSLGLGLFISAATKNQFVASQIALLTGFLPAFLLSGFIFEISSMPWPIQMITYLVPARYLIPPLQTVFVAGDYWGLFLPNIGIMLLFGIVFFGLSFRVTRRRVD